MRASRVQETLRSIRRTEQKLKNLTAKLDRDHRAFGRAAPPPQTPVNVTFWLSQARTTQRGTEPLAARCRQIRHGRLGDLSAGGISLDTRDADDLARGDLLTCSIQLASNADPLVFDTRLQHVRSADSGHQLLGLQFLGLDGSTEGHCKQAHLASVATCFQRLSEDL